MKYTHKLIKRIKGVLPYCVGFASIIVFWSTDLPQSIELQLYDNYVKNKLVKDKSNLSQTIVIGITEDDIKKYGWPLDDIYIFEAIKKLNNLNVSTIGIDLYRDVGVGKGANTLAKYARKNKKVVSIFNVAEGIESIPGMPIDRQAFNDMPIDIDNVVRRNLVAVDREKFNLSNQYTSLPMRLFEIHQKSNNNQNNLYKQLKNGFIGKLNKNSGGYRNLDATGYQVLIDYSSTSKIPIYSLESILEEKNNPNLFNNKIAIIGAVAPSLKDLFPTPESRFIKDSKNVLSSGAVIHAYRTNQLLFLNSGFSSGFKTISQFNEIFISLILGISSIIVIQSVKKIQHSLLIVITTLICFVFALNNAYSNEYWIESVVPITSLMTASGIAIIKKASLHQEQKKLMMKLLGQSTSKEVADQLWQQKESIIEDGKFPGKELDVTIIFSDIVSFTSVSESIPPDELLNWINRGMEKFVGTIINNGGMLNKFTGDGFLAVFGAPIAQDHSSNACSAIDSALKIKSQLNDISCEFIKENLPGMKLRIGIHSGKIIAGSMGCSKRIEYAVLGDTVNIASRLESLNTNSSYENCRILVSSATKNLLPINKYIFKPLGLFKLKGKKKEIEVYELIN